MAKFIGNKESTDLISSLANKFNALTNQYLQPSNKESRDNANNSQSCRYKVRSNQLQFRLNKNNNQIKKVLRNRKPIKSQIKKLPIKLLAKLKSQRYKKVVSQSRKKSRSFENVYQIVCLFIINIIFIYCIYDIKNWSHIYLLMK